jgi:hypothetical protein
MSIKDDMKFKQTKESCLTRGAIARAFQNSA